MEIYTVLMCTKLEEDRSVPVFGSTRLVGFFTDFQWATEVVMENMCDLWEFCYKYAIIEKVKEGLYMAPTERWFFKYDEPSGKYRIIDEPAFLRFYVGLTMG